MTTRSTYGGDIFQGVVQGYAADLMLHGMGVAEESGWHPVMSVHDEVVCEEDTGSFYGVATEHDIIEALGDDLCALPAWAEGLPVAAEGWNGGLRSE